MRSNGSSKEKGAGETGLGFFSAALYALSSKVLICYVLSLRVLQALVLLGDGQKSSNALDCRLAAGFFAPRITLRIFTGAYINAYWTNLKMPLGLSLHIAGGPLHRTPFIFRGKVRATGG